MLVEGCSQFLTHASHGTPVTLSLCKTIDSVQGDGDAFQSRGLIICGVSTEIEIFPQLLTALDVLTYMIQTVWQIMT